MKVRWTKRARKEANKVAEYIFGSFGEKTYVEFLQEIEHLTSLMAEMPNIGATETLLSDKIYLYRSLVVNKKSKIIYRIDGDIIHIVDFWDCHREPKSLTKDL